MGLRDVVGAMPVMHRMEAFGEQVLDRSTEQCGTCVAKEHLGLVVDSQNESGGVGDDDGVGGDLEECLGQDGFGNAG